MEAYGRERTKVEVTNTEAEEVWKMKGRVEEEAEAEGVPLTITPPLDEH